MKLNPGELPNTDGTIMQLTTEELRSLLAEKNQEIEKLKNQPASLEDSWESTYEIISSLEKYKPEEVLFYAAEILSKEMGSKNVAIYTVANREYARLYSSTSLEARRLGNSIKYIAMGELYSELKAGRIYVNERNDPDRPALAHAVYAEEDIRVILMFWDISKDTHGVSPVKRLTVIDTLLQKTILRASRYMSSFRRKNYLEGTNVLNEGTFRVLLKAFLEAKEKGLTECAVVEFEMGYRDYKNISIQVACKIRLTDYMGVLNGGKFYILLANTDIKSAEIVQERFRNLGFKTVLKDLQYKDI
ncbi:hypothetical protein IMSAGC018_01954 [Lachnospiraceae bacterium]|nr:hypothetical protein IMSAGC018_01954 [Lachnospiraceae bacterium]